MSDRIAEGIEERLPKRLRRGRRAAERGEIHARQQAGRAEGLYHLAQTPDHPRPGRPQRPDYQAVFVDTPGSQKPRDTLR